MSGLLKAALFYAFSSAAAYAQNYVPGEVLVKLKVGSGSSEQYAFLGKATLAKHMVLKATWSELNMYHFSLPKGKSVEASIAELKAEPSVQYVEPNYYVKKSAAAGGVEKAFSVSEIQTAQSKEVNYGATSADIGAQTVWTVNTMPSARPIVAVIDTGLDTTHSVITGTDALWTNPNEIPANSIDDDNNGYVDDVHGWNYVDNSGTIYDDDDHGTHVTGIILSLDQNIYSTPLSQAKVQIMPLKFLDGSGTGSTSDAIRAIYYAANMGAKVLNNSWGGNNYSAALNEAIAYTYTKGALFVAAAGNDAANNNQTPLYPASYDVPNTVSVAATTDYDELASFSNFGDPTVHLGSPGVYILSIIPGNQFGTMSGTSMATPFVSGTAAQMLVSSPSMLGYQLKTILLGQTAQIAALQSMVLTSGRLNSAAAVVYAKTAEVSTTQPAYTLSLSGDRGLASSLSGGTAGCGLVRALSEDQNGEPPYGSAVVVLALVLLPIAVLVVLRVRAPENRRKYERFKINSDVRISVGDRELVGSISSLSLGGVQVNTSALLQDGGLITLSISSPSGDEKVEVAGRVVWSAANKAYGVAFDHAPQSALSRFAAWTAQLKGAGSGA